MGPVLQRIIPLTTVLLFAACGQDSAPANDEPAVRPAGLYQVSDRAETIAHRFVGRVEAAQSIDLTFEVSGPLKQLPVREGETIRRGELLAALDPTDFQLAVREAEVQLNLARQDLQRKLRVLEQKGIARSLVDDARSLFELRRVHLDQARESLADSRMVAPFDAYVARRYVDNHVNVNAGEKILRLHDLHRLLVVASVPEGLLATATTEQVLSVEAAFDFIPGQRFPLTYHENRGEADPVAQTYEVSFAMDRPAEWNVLPGMTASIFVQMRAPSAGPALHVPPSALVSHPDRTLFVWVYDPDTGHVSARDVKVGPPESAGIPIVEGLRDGDVVVTTGASQLRAGMQVRPMQPLKTQ